MSKQDSQELPETSVAVISGSLLAATAIVFQGANNLSDVLRLTVSLSVTTLAFSLLTSLWHKFRWPRRKNLFNNEAQRLSESFRNELQQFYDLTLTPLTQRLMQQRIGNVPTPDPAQLRLHVESVLSEARQQIEPFTARIVAGHLSDLEKLKEQYFQSPLQEKWARSRYFLDVVSHRSRLVTFVFGILLFVASIILKIYSEGAPQP